MSAFSPKHSMAYDDNAIYYNDAIVAMDSRPSLPERKMAVTIEPMEPLPARVVSPHGPPLYENHFFSHDTTLTAARKQYFKMFIAGTLMTTILMFLIFSIFWGAFYRTPVRPLPGWIIDFDGGLIGQSVTTGLMAPNPQARISWSVVSADTFPAGLGDVINAVREQKTWMAVTINAGASNRLMAALQSPNSSYDGSQAITVIGEEARNENAFRVILRPSVQQSLDAIKSRFALELSRGQRDPQVLLQLMSDSPQTLLQPIGYQLNNILPFDQPVATVVTFIGLIFLLILSFFIVMIGNGARTATNLQSLLSYPSLVALRLSSSFIAYFFLSLFYSLLSIAFQLNVSRKFGHSGFLVFWMLNYCAMSAVGLALEAMLTLITVNFVPFFMLAWIISNVAVCVLPIEVMPILYRYGYAAPFYNVSGAVRTIIFGAKNEVGFHFGVLIVWIAISCTTLPLFQFWLRRREMAARRAEQNK